MPLFGSKESPHLKKMELKGDRAYGGGSKFNIGNIAGDPFSLATIGIATCGWVVSFVSSIVADINTQFPNFAWWSLAYMLCCIIGIFVTVATNTVFTYHVAIVGFLSAGLVFTTSAVNSLIYQSDAAMEAGAAGFILLSIVCILWIFYYGSQPQAAHRQHIDSFALHKDHAPSQRASRHMTQSYRPETTHSGNPAPQMYNSSALAGFETSSPVTGYPGGRPGEMKRESTSAFPVPLQSGQQQLPAQPPFAGHAQQDGSVSQPAEYPYRAKAIYSYEANPDDANEISFTKHEILEVSDVSGRWWQAKKENGETGIAPSNYLILL